MKAEVNSLVRRLDEVRPNRSAQDVSEPIMATLPARGRKHVPIPPVVKPVPAPSTRKTVVTYKIAPILNQSRLYEAGKWLFFFVAVVLPTLFGGVYYAFFATPQYVSEFRFSVRPNIGATSSAGAAVDVALAMSNSYIVSDYVGSRDAVIALDKKIGLRELFSKSSVDSLSRLDADASFEDLVNYWESRISTSYDMTTGINIIEIAAFSPDDAFRIAVALKELCENLVNQISDGARKSQMDFARSELDRSEARLKDVRRAETEMRTDQRTIDARKEADGRLQLNIKLRGELAALQSQYDSLTTYMDPQSPRLTVLQNQITATREQIGQLQSHVGDSEANAVDKDAVSSAAITRYDQIQTDLEIASKLYESSLSNYEAARAQANNNQIYLATYVQPNPAETASYPRVIFDTFLIFLSACGVWIVLTLVYYSIRDHA